MMKYFIYTICLSLAGVLLTTCIKSPNYPNEPKIVFKSISKTRVQGFPVTTPDSIVFVLTFTDGDGNLGIKSDDPSTCDVGSIESLKQAGCNAYMIDSRTDYVYTYRIPYIQQKGNIKAISGEVRVVRYSPFFW